MKKLRRLKVLTTAAILISSPVFANGDDKVNCRNEFIGNVDIYEGLASCFASTPNGTVYLSQYVNSSPSSFVSLFEPQAGGFTASCSASVPFSSTQRVYGEVCDYTPNAFLKADNFSIGEVYIAASGTDRDGTATVKLLIDGVEQNSKSVFLNAFTGQYYLGQRVKAESVVTDNDGYTTRRVKWVTLEDTGELSPF